MANKGVMNSNNPAHHSEFQSETDANNLIGSTGGNQWNVNNEDHQALDALRFNQISQGNKIKAISFYLGKRSLQIFETFRMHAGSGLL